MNLWKPCLTYSLIGELLFWHTLLHRTIVLPHEWNSMASFHDWGFGVSVDAEEVDVDTYTSRFRFFGFPQGDVGGDSGRLRGAHGRFSPGSNNTHWVGGHCKGKKTCHLPFREQKAVKLLHVVAKHCIFQCFACI